MKQSWFKSLLAPALMLSFAAGAAAKDYFLTVGGGYSPMGNQVSLEKNVLLFQRLLGETYSQTPTHDIFFADGDDPGRDVQFEDPEFEIPRGPLLLAQVFRSTRYLKNQYRDSAIPDVRGAANKENLDRWFNEVGRRLTADDRLVIYVTAHGGRSSDRKQPQNTGLYLWNNKKILMKDFTAMLDRLPVDTPVVTVMVQCYAGGFANIVFEKGDANNGLANGNRCGFFATVHDRVAAGCTPDINEENYQEYSSFFWAAIRGATRTGQPVESCDYDHDGRVSFAEAHAFALLASDSIDISIKTSDAFLRAYSRSKPAPKAESKKPDAKKPDAKKPDEKKQGEPAKAAPPAPAACAADDNGQALPNDGEGEKTSAKAPGEPPAAKAEAPPRPAGEATAELLTAESSFSVLFEKASPVDRVVLDGLSAKLQLQSDARAKEAREKAAGIAKQNKAIDAKMRQKTAAYTQVCRQISQAITLRWPEMSNRWHPAVNQILAEQGDDVVKLIEGHARFKDLDKLRGEMKALATQKLDQDRQWVKCQRLIRALENIALAANLPLVADQEKVEQYQQLLAREAGVFGEAKK